MFVREYTRRAVSDVFFEVDLHGHHVTMVYPDMLQRENAPPEFETRPDTHEVWRGARDQRM